VPTPLTSLIGREDDLARARALLEPGAAARRLVTLCGPGGVGKTRLALEVARSVSASYADGAVFVDLAPLHDYGLVAASIDGTLGLTDSGGTSAADLLLDHVLDRQLLLVLDNFEHLLGAAPLVTTLLQTCANLAVLVTSRRALRVSGEAVYTVKPLATPAADTVDDSPAVHLFVERARAASPEFAVTDRTYAAIAEICRRLDGLPLAIELAAARVSHLPPSSLLERLDRRLPLLVGGGRDLPPRQQTLRGTLAWSHDLLGPQERTLFRRLAAFAGGFLLSAAETVCADDTLAAEAIVDGLGALVDCHLVQLSETAPAGPRFSMLETVREYADDLLEASGEADAIRTRHRDWALALADQAPPEWLDADHLRRLEPEQANLRAALRWTIRRNEAEVGLRLGVACATLWLGRGRYHEARSWLTELLAIDPDAAPSAARARALLVAGYFAACAGDLAAADDLIDRGVGAAEAIGDGHSLALAAFFQGEVLFDRGQPARAERHFLRAAGLAAEAGDRFWELLARRMIAFARFECGDPTGAQVALDEVLARCAGQNYLPIRARALALAAVLAARAGNDALARAQLAEGLSLLERFGDRRGLATTQLLAAHVELDHGDRNRAARQLLALLATAGESRDQWAILRGLEGVAHLVAGLDAQRAVRLAGAAAAARDANALYRAPLDRARLESWLPAARRALGAEAAEQAVRVGRATPLLDALGDGRAACRWVLGLARRG
jgi:non-specific serine/threonine protein kinase